MNIFRTCCLCAHRKWLTTAPYWLKLGNWKQGTQSVVLLSKYAWVHALRFPWFCRLGDYCTQVKNPSRKGHSPEEVREIQVKECSWLGCTTWFHVQISLCHLSMYIGTWCFAPHHHLPKCTINCITIVQNTCYLHCDPLTNCRASFWCAMHVIVIALAH